MSLKHILLGIIDTPRSGYEIKQKFDLVFKHFWSAELAQIYPVLDRLEQNNLATSRQQQSVKGPAKRVYKRTAAGTRELKKWLAGGAVLGKDRLNYLAQVYFLGELSWDLRLQYFLGLKEHFTAELAALQKIEVDWQANDPGYPDNLSEVDQCEQFTLRLGLRKVSGNVQWCDECIAVIEANLPKK